ncbi:MAG: PEGA domain-containing protein [Muribaculaceae bacterium]|nr:PEGA domain-containing protein [Muribaculaceae bacterium]
MSTIEVDLPQGREYTITSDRNGDDVYIDGVKRGVTPLSISLSYGNHEVELLRDGKIVKETLVV